MPKKRYNAELECRQGMPDTMFDPVPMEISDEGDRIRIHVLEYDIERIIYMDGRELPDDVLLSPVGYSIGRWDDDTLVVNTSRVNWPYYSEIGTPQSDQVSYEERLSVSDGGRVLNYLITITDPMILPEPLTIERTREWWPGFEIPPYNCVAHWVNTEG